MTPTKEYAEQIRVAKEKLEKEIRKTAKRKRDKAKEPRRPKKKPKTGLATRQTVRPDWNDEGATAESDDGTSTSMNNSARAV